MNENRRRFRRIRYEHPAEVEVRIESRQPGATARRIRLPVTLRTVSPEGVGLAMNAVQSFVPVNGAWITTVFSVQERVFELPGKIAWHARSSGAVPRIDIGIQLHLELAVAATRKSFATWIVDLTRRTPQEA
jgi:hypothetical protein